MVSKEPTVSVNNGQPKRVFRTIFRAVASTAALGTVIGVMSGGCLSRPVTSQAPTIKDNFTTNLRQSAIDKVDILFDIDNSASMGDKEVFLSKAVPDFLSRLLAPYCVDDQGKVEKDGSGNIITSDTNGACSVGQAEFKPVHDMHIGVVTSSLGTRGGDVCGVDPNAPNNDDRGQLVSRGSAAAVDASGFLAWFPDVDANDGASATPGSTPITDSGQLEDDFKDLVVGVGQSGCGIESQLESWYRFLIQPDPWDHIDTSNGKTASLVGVDETIIKQRHDFLRPDSLVAVIDLTDENDSEIDSRSVSGTGWQFLRSDFDPPKGTAACATSPNDPGCESCEFSSDPACKDSDGKTVTYTANNDWGFDVNLRHVHTKQKYGLDPQFPIDRYFRGLTETMVPDRNAEYKDGSDAPKYPSMFMRTPRSFVGHNAPLVRPRISQQLDYEGEVVLVIGKAGRHIPEASALDHIAAVTLCNEATIRDWVRHAKFNVTQGKNFDSTGSLGPWLVPYTSESQIADIRLTTRVNGEVRQDDRTGRLIFGFRFLLSYISTFTTLMPGDIIVTGTPTGAGARFDPPRYLKPGDVIEVEAEGIGLLRNGVVDES